ncbi:hypothetical protein CEXT_515931 [Caerostris extrusa]|uniref:Uncharacterized protein n=1 Tax=Caerostris extrusa TaxID=172846 RepID=A0AAV4UUY1_CAEEX|nr:hypothetical protein CEXT_515931 [Caerostris extrusa]
MADRRFRLEKWISKLPNAAHLLRFTLDPANNYEKLCQGTLFSHLEYIAEIKLRQIILRCLKSFADGSFTKVWEEPSNDAACSLSLCSGDLQA